MVGKQMKITLLLNAPPRLHYNVHGPLTRYVKLWVAHAPGMPGTFFPPPTSKETGIPGARVTPNFTYLAKAHELWLRTSHDGVLSLLTIEDLNKNNIPDATVGFFLNSLQ